MLRELRSMVALAWPVILAEIGWVLMGVVDTIMVGPLGPAAIGAAGIGSTIFLVVMVAGMGTLFSLDTFVSQSFGAGRLDECHRWLFAGLQLALLMSCVLVPVGLGVTRLLPHSGIHPDVLILLRPYLGALLWSAPPLLVYTVLRRYLQAMNVVWPILVVVVVTNLINAAGNWMFVYGRFGLPAMGTVGSAYATVLSRMSLALLLGAIVVRRERHRPTGLGAIRLGWDTGRMRQLVRLGVPVAMQVVLEVSVFGAISILAARISPTALAAHQVVLSIASFFFMLPFGLSSAAAVRVGQAMGRADAHGVRVAGWSAVLLALTFAAVVALLLITMARLFLGIFTRDIAVLDIGVPLLGVCALFQPFDGCQAVATGALRGLGDTRTPMLSNIGHWLIGLPLAYLLCFSRGWGVLGLWSGLTVSLILIGVTLVAVWHRRTRPGAELWRIAGYGAPTTVA